LSEYSRLRLLDRVGLQAAQLADDNNKDKDKDNENNFIKGSLDMPLVSAHEPPMACCKGRWAVYDIIKQYLGNMVHDEAEAVVYNEDIMIDNSELNKKRLRAGQCYHVLLL
jgi:hypothetical protein